MDLGPQRAQTTYSLPESSPITTEICVTGPSKDECPWMSFEGSQRCLGSPLGTPIKFNQKNCKSICPNHRKASMTLFHQFHEYLIVVLERPATQ